jgi:hypothetical protein
MDREPDVEMNPSTRPTTWDDFLLDLANADTPVDFLDEHERDQLREDRDPSASRRE